MVRCTAKEQPTSTALLPAWLPDSLTPLLLQAAPFGLSKEQSEGVLSLTLRRLTSLEEAKLKDEQATLQAK